MDETICEICQNPIPEERRRKGAIFTCSPECTGERRRRRDLERRKPEQRYCEICQGPISMDQQRRASYPIKYCSPECRTAGRKKRWHPASVTKAVVGARGAGAEYLVVADLLARGFEVYKALNPTAATDLLLEVGGRFYRVEVKMGHLTALGRVRWSRRRGESHREELKRKQADLLAVVVDAAQIVYEPPLEQLIERAG